MTATQHQTIEFVRLRIGPIRYVLPVATVAAVLDLAAMESSVTPPGGLWLGVIRSRQSVIRVASGAHIFGGEPHDERSAKVVVFRTGLPVGITVDEVLGSRVVARGDIYPLPDTAGSRRQLLVHSVAWADGAVELALDGGALVEALSVNDVALEAGSVPSIVAGFDGPGDDALEVTICGSDERWGIPISAVRHVAGFRQPQPLARAARDVVGLLAWQRHPVPLIDAAARLGLPAVRPDSGQIVVVGEPLGLRDTLKPALAALLVRQVLGIQTVVQRRGERLQTADGGVLRRLDLSRLLNDGYRADSRATVLDSAPIPSISMTT